MIHRPGKPVHDYTSKFSHKEAGRFFQVYSFSLEQSVKKTGTVNPLYNNIQYNDKTGYNDN